MQTAINLLLALIVLLSLSVQRAYHSVPTRELKKRAREGDEIAAGLFKAAAYGLSLRLLLWVIVIAASAWFFVYLALTTPVWVALTVTAAVVWFGYVWLPAKQVSSWSAQLARAVAPLLAWLLNYLHPYLDRLVAFARRHHPVFVHTGLYDKEDLIDLLERQHVQADNRVTKAELELAYNALTISEKQVRDIMIPRRVVKMVNADEAVGPILMTEVHESGHSRYPVYDGKKDNIVGTIYLRDLMGAKEGGSVRDVMRAGDVCYIHEEQSLIEALQAILKTRRHLFIVVNSFEEYVGVVTIEDVLEHIIGKPIVDEFDQYEDLRAVAAREAKEEHKAHQKTATIDVDADGIVDTAEEA